MQNQDVSTFFSLTAFRKSSEIRHLRPHHLKQQPPQSLGRSSLQFKGGQFKVKDRGSCCFIMVSTQADSSAYSESEVAQSCPTRCDPVDCSPPGSSVHGILQARILEWVAISFSRGSSRPRHPTQVSSISCIEGRFFTH